MKIYVAKDYQEMSRKAANILSAQVIMKPDCVLGLATGSTPEGIYSQLVDWYRKGDLDFSAVRTVNLDEYKGIAPDSDQSYAYYMNKNLFSRVNIHLENTYLPNGLENDAAAECTRYDQVIEKLGGTDIQLLGIGANGHIGFNEPCDVFEPGTHCVTLSESTIQANARFFATLEEVPRQAYTMGIGSIMRARTILLVANGESKAEAVYRSLCGPVTPQVPASVLQLHPDVTIVADEAALSKVRP